MIPRTFLSDASSARVQSTCLWRMVGALGELEWAFSAHLTYGFLSHRIEISFTILLPSTVAIRGNKEQEGKGPIDLRRQ